MFNKIVFLCADPCEKFLSYTVQGHSRKYYQATQSLFLLKQVKIQTREYIDLYGEAEKFQKQEIFWENKDVLQMIYIQSNREKIIKQVFRTADIVIMGIPGSREEFEKIYRSIFPWKDEIMFLWSNQVIKEPAYLQRLLRECMIKQEQIIEIGECYRKILGFKKAPELIRELISGC